MNNLETPGDELLPLSRRLDWRFLLPDPTLSRVMYLGPSDSSLLQSLQRFGGDVVREIGPQQGLAILINPSISDFTLAVRAADSLYVELHRSAWQHRLIARYAPGTFLRVAGTHGFDAQAYWHYPDFETADRIIPLSAVSPLSYIVAKGRRDRRTRLMVGAAAWLLESGLIGRVVPCISIVGHRA